MTSGRIPPTRNRPRQPKRGSTCAPTSPASDPPSGMQTIVSVTANGRCRIGTYSEESAAAFGIAPPRPKPAKKRRTVSTATPFDIDTSSVSSPNATTLPMSATRRPRRSPTTPPIAPPSIIPTMPAVWTGTKAGRGSRHSRINAGSAAPSSWLSSPSRMIVIAVAATSSF